MYYLDNNISKTKTMKKLLFVLAFTFIGGQAFSQMYIVVIDSYQAGNCTGNVGYRTLSITDPAGNTTHVCIQTEARYGISELNQELNNIVNLGYKLIETSYSNGSGLITSVGGVHPISSGTSFIFAIPWSASGLEEVPVNSTTLKSFLINPNPANTFVDISLDYSLKGESEVVFISEAGYIFHKQSIGNISKNEKYNIDISKILAGKYLVTIVNGKTYTTPQKLVVVK